MPSIAKELRLTPQAKSVLRHLESHGYISPMKAEGVYGITRLASCIHEIRKAGHFIITQVLRDDVGHKFAKYTLVRARH